MTLPTNRRQKVRLKTARGRKISSQRWLQRQLNDPYVRKAQAEGYRSRAAYKLLEIMEKYPQLASAKTVVDLGAAPGGWTQVARDVMCKKKPTKIVALDILEMDPLEGVEVIQGDFTQDEVLDQLMEKVTDPVDFVLSDMSPSTSGHQPTDHLRIIAFVEMALDFALKTLRPGGHFVAKVFQGGAQGDLLKEIKSHFEKVHHFKPPASRKTSPEMYLIALGFKGNGLKK